MKAFIISAGILLSVGTGSFLLGYLAKKFEWIKKIIKKIKG